MNRLYVDYKAVSQKRTAILHLMFFACAMGCFSSISQGQGRELSVFLLDQNVLLKIRHDCQRHDKKYEASLDRLKMEADALLNHVPPSVVSKSQVPPSGDKHDYMSLAPYWWPNPDSKDSLPYIRRDGQVNPEIGSIKDHAYLAAMAQAVQKLSLAYFYIGNERYAIKATAFLEVWFLNPDTKMNPHLKFGQAVRGLNVGRGIGLIETRWFSVAIDGIGLLRGSKAWTKRDEDGMKQWFEQYFAWLQNSPLAHDERDWGNNHGVWFDVQYCSIALFTGHRDLAVQELLQAKTKRIAAQIEPDGRMPKELERTKSLGYTTFDLQAFTQLACLGEHIGVDLWFYKTSDGRSIRKALDWVLPFIAGESKWEFQQIDHYNPGSAYPILRLAARHFSNVKYEEIAQKVKHQSATWYLTDLMYGY